MLVLYLKAFHVISMVCWFSGLFYVPRLFMYHVEANSRSEQERDILQKQLEKRAHYQHTYSSEKTIRIKGPVQPVIQ